MFERFIDILEDSGNIVFFGGAGVSTESGIPDFRSESGLYATKKEYGYSPEEIISHTFFKKYPDIFFSYYKNKMIYRDAEPNQAHIGLAMLEKMGKLGVVVTQNIDGLHQRGGSKRVHEIHGSVHRNYCVGCGEKYSLDYIMNGENCNGSIPICEKCGDVVRPEVTLYEEALDEKAIGQAVEAISRADTLIIGGTSLVVYPAAGFVDYFRGDKLVVINKGDVGRRLHETMYIGESIGRVFEEVVEHYAP